MTTKQALLQYLLSCPDQPLSGQALADKLGVSRMAVSKAAVFGQRCADRRCRAFCLGPAERYALPRAGAGVQHAAQLKPHGQGMGHGGGSPRLAGFGR